MVTPLTHSIAAVVPPQTSAEGAGVRPFRTDVSGKESPVTTPADSGGVATTPSPASS
jgi:hypothetical protein